MIVVATEKDVSALVTLGKASYLHHYGSIWSATALQDYMDEQFAPALIEAEIAGGQSQYLMMHDEDALVGYAKINFNRKVPLDPARSGTELQKIYFLPEATGHGFGRRLIEYILAEATRAGEDVVWLDVLKTNDGGRRLYERCGFRVAGELPFATDIQQIDFWVMVHDLRR
jgi:ribosomal protein S18 acetylase RimI-like enzyme